MKKNSAALSLVGASALALFSMNAALAKAPLEWTCGEFLKVPEHAKANVIYWMDGFKKGGKSASPDVSAEDFKHPIGKVILECRKNQTENLWDAIVKHFYSSAEQIP